jgi:signal transduction histidine kinase
VLWNSQPSFAIISRNARRLERLATDILDVTRIETQSLHLEKELFDLYELAEQAISDIENQYPQSKLRYIIKVDRGTMVFADRSKIGQVVSNLLSNAAKFTDEGEISVTGYVERNSVGKDLVQVSVSDTGTGIDSEIFPRLFTKFTNRAGIDRTQTGVGLGLFISKGLIEAHDGKIWAENNPSGKGAKFTFILPQHFSEIQKV